MYVHHNFMATVTYCTFRSKYFTPPPIPPSIVSTIFPTGITAVPSEQTLSEINFASDKCRWIVDTVCRGWGRICQ
jgi:hypothetical protein